MVTHSSILAWKNPRDRGAWWATVHGVARVGHNLVTKPPLSLTKVQFYQISIFNILQIITQYQVHRIIYSLLHFMYTIEVVQGIQREYRDFKNKFLISNVYINTFRWKEKVQIEECLMENRRSRKNYNQPLQQVYYISSFIFQPNHCKLNILFSAQFTDAAVLSHSVLSTSLQSYGLQPTRFVCPRNFSGKNTGVDCHFLLQGIFPTQGSNPHLCVSCSGRQIHYHCTTLKVPLYR